eukprot:13795149-Alexandrium_andersonii.AAC.1
MTRVAPSWEADSLMLACQWSPCCGWEAPGSWGHCLVCYHRCPKASLPVVRSGSALGPRTESCEAACRLSS